tara:strand:+ start:24 stop:278 length:255 start_codon:yes stop_codon:yes gene_type:complete
MLVYTKYPRPHLRRAKTTRFSRQLEGDKMIMFNIYEENTRTKKTTLVGHIEADNIVNARKAFIKRANWEPRRHVKLVVRSPPMR